MVQGVSEHFQKSTSRHIRPSAIQCEPYNAWQVGGFNFIMGAAQPVPAPPIHLAKYSRPISLAEKTVISYTDMLPFMYKFFPNRAFTPTQLTTNKHKTFYKSQLTTLPP